MHYLKRVVILSSILFAIPLAVTAQERGKCGDGVCDSFEQRSAKCPQDCGGEKTETSLRQQKPSQAIRQEKTTQPGHKEHKVENKFFLYLDEGQNRIYLAKNGSSEISLINPDTLSETGKVNLTKPLDATALFIDSLGSIMLTYSKSQKDFELVDITTGSLKCAHEFTSGPVVFLDNKNQQAISFSRSGGIESYGYDCNKKTALNIDAEVISRVSNDGEAALASSTGTGYSVAIIDLGRMEQVDSFQLSTQEGKLRHRIRLNNKWVVLLTEDRGASKVIIWDGAQRNSFSLDIPGDIAEGADPQITGNSYFIPMLQGAMISIVRVNFDSKEISQIAAENAAFAVNSGGNKLYLIDNNGKVTTSAAAGIKIPSVKSTPVYVTIFSHNERGLQRFGGLRESRDTYREFRDSLIRVAQLIHSYGAKYSWQTDYLFLEGIEKFEQAILTDDPDKTKGKPILKYLAEDLQVSIEPHAHECLGSGMGCQDKKYNYADIVYLIKNIGQVEPALVIGGTTSGERTLSDFNSCIKANVYEYTWCPEALTLYAGSSGGHRGTDDMSSGVWRPKELGADFYTDNPQGRIIYIGPGSHMSADFNMQGSAKTEPMVYLKDLVNKIETQQLPSGKIYTASLGFAESWMIDFNEYANLEKYLKELKPLIEEGKVIPVTYAEVIDIWKKEYDSQPNIYLPDNLKAQDQPGRPKDSGRKEGKAAGSRGDRGSSRGDGRGSSGGGNRGSCGDGTCDNVEQKTGRCPQDCQ